ncbi:mercury(II) reductase [Thermoflavimicrobium dichotomicum]|uniref:Mercuric reductase n=1 Tax=Thermoflavimicrobium dichotomicum TaxID=46223 RepID=A0A1I3LAW1_9BACL|nr:mercury(II) reductase [Thermoflavimicrobium dichotomicum]SFI81867.1 mercuric reductase [Thermoflavimicrobium dichotomicum]
MAKTTIHIRIPVQGMICKGCEEHVTKASEKAGAKQVTADFCKGEATFQIDLQNEIENVKQAIDNIGYKSGDPEIVYVDTPESTKEGDYGLLIIGSGSAAFSAAIEASKHGVRVAMVERGTIGGTCVNIGCVPSKTMLRAGEINHLALRNPFMGLHTFVGPVDLAQLVEQKNELVNQLRQQKYVNLIDVYGFTLIQGEARFVDGQTVEVNGQKITAKSFLIATGASPAIPDIPGLQEVDYLTSTTALELKEVPKRLAVIGAGYVGLELSNLFHHLGSEVTLLQRGSRILPKTDPEIADAATKALSEKGIQLLTNVTFERVEMEGTIKRVYISVNGEKRVVEAEHLLIATGRKPNTESLNLDAAGVKAGSHNEVIVDEYLRTSNPRIYAAGDVTMGPQFVYVAAYEGAIAAENALGVNQRKIDLRVVPKVTFTNPAIATVGLTEEQAKVEGHEVKTSVLPLDAVPRAIVNYETTGVIKLVADAKTQRILGVHMVAENAGEVIYAATLAVKFGLTVKDLRETLAPYLTMAEGLKLAALAFDKDVNRLSCCAG